MDIARLGVVIDPTQTRSGAAEIKADLKAIGAEAKAMQGQIVAAVEKAAADQKQAFKEVAEIAKAAARATVAEQNAVATAAQIAAKEKAAAEKQAAAEARTAAKQTAAEQKAAAQEAAAVVKAQAAEKAAAENRAAAATKAAAREAAAVAAAAAAERQRAEQRAAAAARESAAATRGALRGLFSEVSNGLQIVASFIPGVSGMFLTLAGTAGGAATGIGAVASSCGALLIAIVPLLAVLALMTAALVALGASLVFGDKMNASIGRIAAATRDLETARAVYESLYQTSLRTGAAIDESAGSFVRFAVAARGIGASHAQVLQLVETIQKAGVVGGGSASELTAAATQLGQALASGRLQGDELRSILENMPTLAEKLAKELGTSVGGLRKMGEEGKLSADVLFPALLRTTTQIRKEFDAMPPTMARGFASLRISIARLFADLDQATGFSKAIGKGLADAALEADRLRRVLIGAIAGGNVGEIIGANLKVAAMEFTNLLVRGLVFAAAAFAAGMALAATGHVTIVSSILRPEFWSAVGSLGKAAFLTIVDAMRTVAQSLIDMIVNAALAFKNQFPEWLVGSKAPPAGTTISAGAGIDVGAARAREDAAAATRALMNVTAAQFTAGADVIVKAISAGMAGVGQVFPSEEIDRLKAVRDELERVALATAKMNAELEKTTTIAVDPTKWQGAGTAPKLDTEIVKDLQERIRFFEANAAKGNITRTAADRGIEAARQGATSELGDPRAASAKYPQALEQWRAFHEERRRIAEDADRRIEAGNASMFESFNRGLQQAADSWGNAQQQMVKLATGVANSLTNNVAAGLTAIVTGSKDAKTAFRDMALAILNDIARMIIQLLVELAVRQAIKAISGYASGGSVSGNFDAGARASASGAGGGGISAGAGAVISAGGSAGTISGGASYTPVEPPLPTGGAGDGGPNLDYLDGYSGAGLFASGGRIHGGSGGIDDVPAWLTSGEYVINKQAVDTYGTSMLDAINERRAKRYAEGGRVASAPVGAAATGGDTYAFDIKIDAGGATGGASGQAGSQGDEARRRKELGELMKNTCMNVLVEQKRPGGLLNAR